MRYYSLVKESVLAEGLKPITIRGIAKPIRIYRVVDIYNELVEEGQIIYQEKDGITIIFDLLNNGKECAICAIEEMLSQLKR